MTGDWTSNSFTITNPPWNVGWAFHCVPAPASGPSLEVFVTPVGGKQSATAAIEESGVSGQQNTPLTSLGQQTVTVESPSTCVWAIKVTGR
jgi:hypothetical protein